MPIVRADIDGFNLYHAIAETGIAHKIGCGEDAYPLF
jgi:hypothetical protein